VFEDGMATSSYGGEDTWKVRGVGYSPVGNKVIPSCAKNASLACRMECLQHPSASLPSTSPSRPTARTQYVVYTFSALSLVVRLSRLTPDSV